MQNFKPASTSKIALLLPLDGQTAVFSRTIQQGFEAARSMGTRPVAAPVAVAPTAVPATATTTKQPQTTNGVASPFQASMNDLTDGTPAQPETPAVQPIAPAQPATVGAPTNPSVELKVYDTSSQPLNQVLTRVQQGGASIVVGPLLKNNAEELMKSNAPLNVLALNQPESMKNLPNVYYFALSPEDEARDAVRHIRNQEKQTPLLLIPRSSLGDHVANTFAQEWQRLGDGVVLQQKFGSTTELRMGVNGGSGIPLTGSPVVSPVPAQPGVTTGGLTILAASTDAQIASGSGRVDAVYILATPEEITFIKPMTAMHNDSQSGTTLYTSSRSTQGTADPDFRLEMENLQYNEIPMLAGTNAPLVQQALGAVRNGYSLARIYAMGVDAWSLANRFLQMRQVQGFEINGNTGALTATQSCAIDRKLSQLKYQQGQVVPAS